jgi:hypothetical protein
MKIFYFFFTLYAMPVVAAECKLIGVLESTQSIETSFVTATIEGCKAMAESTKSNNFYGLVENQDQLVETRFLFKEEETDQDVVTF